MSSVDQEEDTRLNQVSGPPYLLGAHGAPVVTMTNVIPEEHDLVIIGGGVAGYVAAIKAGQEGLKVFAPS